MSVVALDIGTSRMKALLATWDGRILGARSVRTPTEAAATGHLVFPVPAIHAEASTLVSGLAGAHPDDPVDTLVFSCLGTAMVPVDRAGIPLGPALSPADVRPSTIPGLMQSVDLSAETLIEITGQDPRLSSFLLHWLWWRRTRPDVIRKLHRFRSLRGFLVHALCGADAEDPSWASRTMLMDLVTDTWSTTILAAAGLPGDALPEIRPSTTAWPVGSSAARRFGLAPGARIVLGGMDNCTSVFGASHPGERRLANIAGTYEHMAGIGALDTARSSAAAVAGLVHRYLLPARYLSYSRVALGLLLLEAAAGSPSDLGRLLEGVSESPVGQGMPLDADAVRSALRAGTPPGVVIQRLLEASADVLVRYADAWDAAGERTDRIVVVGGGAARSRPLQLKANLLGRSLSTLTVDEAAGLGALRLAAMAVRGASPSAASQLFPNPILRTWVPEVGSV